MLKNIRSLASGLRFVLKYAALVSVIIEIVQFAIQKLETVEFPENENNKKDLSSSPAGSGNL
jgi:hypothetical protein